MAIGWGGHVTWRVVMQSSIAHHWDQSVTVAVATIPLIDVIDKREE